MKALPERTEPVSPVNMDFSDYLVKIPSPMEFDCDAYKTLAHIPFFKYHGCGNDFIIIDNESGFFDSHLTNAKLIHTMCNRRVGIGADGLIIFSKCKDYNFEILYYNADGKEGSMCGNGNRCALAFANYQGLMPDYEEVTFLVLNHALSGGYVDKSRDLIKVTMIDIPAVTVIDEDNYFLDTGSPHYIQFIHDTDISNINIKARGSDIRHKEEYRAIGGTNANFVQIADNETVQLRTFERGVEEETFACGTGAIAAAVVAEIKRPSVSFTYNNGKRTKSVQRDVKLVGGSLQVRFNMTESSSIITNVVLIGPAKAVFHGVYTCRLPNQ